MNTHEHRISLIGPKQYRGADAKKQRLLTWKYEQARHIQAYLRERVSEKEAVVFLHSEIARDLGIDAETVEELLGPAGGGANGITL